MAMENYKKISIAVIVLSIAAIVVITTISSQKSKMSTTTERSNPASPAGPMLGAEPLMEASTFTDDPKKLAEIGDTFFDNQNYAQAVIVYEKALKLSPDDVDTYNDLGLAYLYTGRSGEAIETLRKGTETDPAYQRIWLSLGFTLLSQKQEEEGRKALEKAVALNPATNIGQEAKRMIGLIN